MSGYQFTPQASDDLFEIWRYIAQDSLQAAERVESAVHEACAFLAEGPLRGQVRTDVTELPVRFWTL
jgi:plasmid stabilization system protein ParE